MHHKQVSNVLLENFMNVHRPILCKGFFHLKKASIQLRKPYSCRNNQMGFIHLSLLCVLLQGQSWISPLGKAGKVPHTAAGVCTAPQEDGQELFEVRQRGSGKDFDNILEFWLLENNSQESLPADWGPDKHRKAPWFGT